MHVIVDTIHLLSADCQRHCPKPKHKPNSTVTHIAVEGVCRMANDYWELIPKEIMVALFQHIVKDLAR